MNFMNNPSSLLMPRPKRAAGVKRLNHVPKILAGLVVLIFIGGVLYTAIKRHESTIIEQKESDDTKKVEGSKAPPFLVRDAHGEVPSDWHDKIQAGPPPLDQKPPSKTAPDTPSIVADQSGDIAEQARARAWQQYFQQIEALNAKRYELNLRAITGGDAQQGVHIAGDAGMGGGVGAPNSGTPGVAGAPAGVRSANYSTGGTDPDGQTGKQAFLNTKGDPFGVEEDLPGSVHGPKPMTIMEGTPLPGRLAEGATSDSPGQLVAEIMTNVCDSMTGQILLIPQGTRIITKYDTAVSAGQDRIGTIAQRLVFPDTSSRQLGSMQIADQSGMAGLKDKLNTHFWEKFWATATISLVGAGAQLAQPQQSAFSGYSPSSVGIGAMTQGFSQLGQSIAQRNLSIPNTIELRAGLPLVVKPNHDIPLPQYIDARGYTGNGGPCS